MYIHKSVFLGRMRVEYGEAKHTHHSEGGFEWALIGRQDIVEDEGSPCIHEG